MFRERPVIIGTTRQELIEVLNVLGCSPEAALLLTIYERRETIPTKKVRLFFPRSGEWLLTVDKRYNLQKLRVAINRATPQVRVLSAVEWADETFPRE